MPITCIAGDTHFPFADPAKIRAFLARVAYLKPQIVLQIGDALDLMSWGRFPRSTCLMTPAQELKRGRAQAEEFWQRVRAAAGKRAKLYQLIGNHDERPAKRMLSQLPDFEPFLDDYASWWRFDGVHTQPSQREELILGGVVFMHGYRKHGEHVKHNLKNTVVGHSHVGGVVYLRLGNRTLWELNAGYLGNPRTVALSYTAQAKISKWTPGMGEIEDGQPRFITL